MFINNPFQVSAVPPSHSYLPQFGDCLPDCPLPHHKEAQICKHAQETLAPVPCLELYVLHSYLLVEPCKL